MSSPTVVFIYNRYLNRGGEDEVFESEVELLSRNGCNAIPLTAQMVEPTGLWEKLAIAKNSIWANDWYAKISAILDKTKPDLVHVHNLFPMISPSIYYACQAKGVPVVQTLHNYRMFCPATKFYRNGKICEECVEHSLWRSIRYGCYRDSQAGSAAVAMMLIMHRWLGTWTETVDCYITPTEFARRKFIESGLPGEKIVAKPNFVYPDPGSGSGNGLGQYGVIVGRISEDKGLRTVLDAWQRLSSSIPLRIVGEGPLRETLEAEVVRRDLSGIRFEGRLSYGQTLAIIKKAGFLVVASEWYETFGRTIVEAFACGVPVVASCIGAIKELVVNAHTGLHFNPGDADDLAAKVEWAWAHPERMQEMGRAARAEFEAKYTAERNYQMLMEIYQRVLLNRGKAAEKVNNGRTHVT